MPGNPTIDNLNPTFYQQLLAFVSASGGRVTLAGGSGWRSVAQQAQLYADYQAGKKGQARAAPPGKSNHNFGLAFDLVYKADGQKWALANAARFGLNFPMGDEPWHVEPIGVSEMKNGTSTAGAGAANFAMSGDPKALYGYLGWYVDHPEVGPIIRTAAAQGWDQATLQAALANTNWWKTTSETARQWEALLASDPAQYQARLDETKLSLKLDAHSLGIPLDDARAVQIATDANRLGWNPDELRLALAAEMRFNPGQTPGGQVGSTMGEVRKVAGEHMVPVNDQQAWEWARRIVAGTADMGAVNAQMKNLALARFPHIADQINQGVTPGQFFAPYRNVIGGILDRSPESIDLMDERWAPVVGVGAGDQVRPMSFGEVARFARADPSWGTTNDARQNYSDLQPILSQLLGV